LRNGGKKEKVTEEHIVFSSSGLKLEGIIHLPKCDTTLPAVVICHPHPLYGGDMHNNVVMAISAALAEIPMAALRFNFRGVGRSEGEYDEGNGEQDDVVAALAFLESLGSIDRSRIGLAGYSFGAKAALPVALRQRNVQAVALVSPFLADVEWEQLKSYATPKLFLCGSEDDFIAARKVQRLAAGLPGISRCQIIAGADHFWWGYEAKVAEKVASFLKVVLQTK
jgi:alpha/beta superfamily hydrolase